MEEWEQILELKKQQDEIVSEIGELQMVICEKVHPYKIGETITVKGYSFKGKKMIVTDVWFREDCGMPSMGVRGIVLSADGKKSKNGVGWNNRNDENMELMISGLK